MDIAAASMGINAANVQTQVSIALLKNVLDSSSQLAQVVVDELVANVEVGVNLSTSGHLDMYI